ncbi:MAG: methyltransferase [Gaiellaceae bacterium]
MAVAPAPVSNWPLIKRVAAFLADAGFAVTKIQRVLRTEGELLATQQHLPVQLLRLEQATEPLATLVALFVLEVSLDAEDADRRLQPLGVGPLVELGLVEETAPEVRGAVRIVPHDHLLIVSDRPRTDTGRDHVAGVHRPSAALAHLTVRRRVERALDVGTGNGIQALLAAEHSGHVVATDINERALEFAQFNAALNGVENIEFRMGSFFEPVAGKRFGLVVCNPPYVVTPDTEFRFRDGGLEGDQVSERVATELPSALEEGAFGTMMASWTQSGDDPGERPRSWLEGSGCDAWVLYTAIDDPLSTAAAWNRDAAPDQLAGRLDRWLAYYRERGIEAVTYGAFVLRRRAPESNWIRVSPVPRSGITQAGPHLLRLFAAQDLLATASDDDLLAARFRLHDDVRLEHALRPAGDGWSADSAELALTTGLPFRAGLDDATTAIVRGFSGSRPLGTVLTGAAAELGIDEGRFVPAGVQFVRRLLEFGYAVPA